MAVAHDLTRDAFAYTSDDTTVYQLGTTKQNGIAQSATPINSGDEDIFPRGWVPRLVYGISSTGAKTKLPIFTPSNTLWTGGAGGTFTKDGVTYDVVGCRGEQRYVKGVPAVAH
jgi:hypothetical protein